MLIPSSHVSCSQRRRSKGVVLFVVSSIVTIIYGSCGSGRTIISIATAVTTVLNKEQSIDRHRHTYLACEPSKENTEFGAFFGPKKEQNRRGKEYETSLVGFLESIWSGLRPKLVFSLPKHSAFLSPAGASPPIAKKLCQLIISDTHLNIQ